MQHVQTFIPRAQCFPNQIVSRAATRCTPGTHGSDSHLLKKKEENTNNKDKKDRAGHVKRTAT